MILALLVLLVVVICVCCQKCYNYEIQLIHLKSMNRLYSLWQRGKESEKQFTKFFSRYNIDSVAIYGMGKAGKILYDQLQRTDVEIRYVIDQNTNLKYKDLRIVSPQSELPDVDLIIITVVYEYNAIARQLRKKVNCPLLSLEQLLI